MSATIASKGLKAVDFFAGSGLVSLGLSGTFKTVWANDNCAKKRQTFVANHDAEVFDGSSIVEIRGKNVPRADLAWASFPCQDLSLAGVMSGMECGTRSGLFWEWIRVLQEMKQHGNCPSVLVAENVVGFLVANNGADFRNAYVALRKLGYRVGAVVINAHHFLPQSRKRAFLVAALPHIPLNGLIQHSPSEPFHPSSLIRASLVVDDPDWIWWSLPIPDHERASFSDLCERQAPYDPPSRTKELCEMLSLVNRRKLDVAVRAGAVLAGTGYRRTRPNECGGKSQRLEIRFDGTAGCLRSPNGGSSRQTVLIIENGNVHSRLMTVRECARLMGAPDTYLIPGTYNDGYRAMGDAVAVPVTKWLAKHLLEPLARRAKNTLLQSGHLMYETSTPSLGYRLHTEG